MSTRRVQHALGIDFGTSNSYFSDVRVGGLELSYTDLKFHDGQSSVPTCILYEQQGDESWKPHSFGNAAIELWKDLMEDERSQFRFRGGFKPDISFDPQAYQDAVSFFQCTKDYLKQQRLITHFSPESGRQLVVGVPAKNVPGQEETTLKALEEAGLFDVVLIPEPEGALFYHLYYDNDRITVERAHQGVLVVDFGGGTFDVAYLRDGVVQQNWGNPMLGGRLFDDLFYQWFLELQGGEETRAEMREDGTLEYLRSFGFRRLKERFSSAWHNEQLGRFRERITVGVDFDYGVFRGATLEEFYRRARHYTASADLLKDLELLEDKSVEALREGEIDLLAQIRAQLSGEVLQELGLEDLQITATVLTGGSCRWPFMTALIQEAFPDAECFQSPDPEATISRGLALCFAFREYSKDVSGSLTAHQDQLHKDVVAAVREAYREFADRVAAQFSRELYGQQIQPIFTDWRSEGGSIADLEQRTEEAARSYFEGPGRTALERERTILQERVEELVDERLFAWLRKHRVTRAEYLSLEEHLQQMHDDDLQVHSQMSGVLDGFFEAIKYTLSGIVGVIIAAVAGGSGMALLMSGPIGWLIGLILGGAATFAALQSVDTKSLPIPPFALKMTATDERLQKAQGTFQEDMEQRLLDLFFEKEVELELELEKSIAQLVERLAHTIPVTAVMKND